MNKIYISDMDGTLLKNNATLSDYSKENLIKLIGEGVNFTVASARSVVAIQKILHGVPLECALSNGCIPFISSYNGSEDCLYYETILNDGMKWYINDRTRAEDKRLRKSILLNTLKENVVCYTIIDEFNKLKELSHMLEEKYSKLVEIHLIENQYSPRWYWLTVHDCKATKDQAIKLLLDQFGFNKEHLTVFGDNANDIKMFKLAPNRIAVDNAKQVLKEHATEIIGTNEEDSVVKYIINKEKCNVHNKIL